MRKLVNNITVVISLILLFSNLSASQRPNILLVLIDDLGRESVGCYGGESYETPNLDSVARKGLLFNRFFASPKCHPTRVALMTGNYLHSVGNPKWGDFPENEFEEHTLANALKRVGYATVASGKWHLKKLSDDPSHPHRLGFDEFCFFGWHEGPRYWQPLIWQNGEIRNDVYERFGPDVYYDYLVDFISREREQPFFAFYSMTLAHAVSNDLDYPPPHGPNGRYMSFKEMLSKADQYIGNIVSTIESLGIAENTLIFILSDNGTSPKNFIRHDGPELVTEPTVVSRISGVDISGQKGRFNDWGVCVPAIAYWPEHIQAGQTSNALLDVTDLLPTFWELASDSKLEFSVEGKSFVSGLFDSDYSGREWVSFQTTSMIGVRSRNWKLLSNGEFFKMRNNSLRIREPKIDISTANEDELAAYRRLQEVLNRLQ